MIRRIVTDGQVFRIQCCSDGRDTSIMDNWTFYKIDFSTLEAAKNTIPEHRWTHKMMK